MTEKITPAPRYREGLPRDYWATTVGFQDKPIVIDLNFPMAYRTKNGQVWEFKTKMEYHKKIDEWCKYYRRTNTKHPDLV